MSSMQKKKILLLAIIMVFVFVITGCSDADNGKEEYEIEDYYDSRVQYVGDNSKVSQLLNVLGAGDLGEYSIALKTDQEPYELTVNFSKLSDAEFEAKIENGGRIDFAYFALALIENLNEITVNFEDYNYRLSREQADELVDGDIKDYGNSIEKLNELNDILKD